MNFKIFAELIELKAKTASIFPFLLGLAYSLYHYQSVNLSALAIYFVAMFMFNCFVDIWDNYNDYHKAVDTDDYQKNTNIIGRENLSMGLIKSLLAFFFFGSLILGIIVALMTGWPVFWLGLLGYVIFLICLYINSSQNFVWSFANLATTFLIALPNTLLIANLMLANNTCDLEEDEANHRYTIVHYIGKKAALIWWTTALILAFVAIVVAVILGLLSPIMLLIL